MNLEQLQTKSDAELNRLAAVHILWGGIVNVPSEDWKPTTDLNDAMRLFNILHTRMWEMELYCDHQIQNPWECKLYFNDGFNKEKFVKARECTPSKAITITCILAQTLE